MKAVIVEGEGPDGLVVADIPVPTPAPGEALVRVVASGVNYGDTRLRAEPGSKPLVSGFEAAGVIEAFGQDTDAGITDLAVGCRVLTTLVPGTYAEYVAVPVHRLHKVPDNRALLDAAAMPGNFLTAWLAVHHRGEASAGQKVLIHAAGGGVGSAAVQLAVRAGAEVIAAASSAHKLELAKGLGAKSGVLAGQGFSDRILEASGETRPLDLVVDSVGGDTLIESLDLLKPWGRYVGYGQSSEEHATLDVYRAAIPFHLELRFFSLRQLAFSSHPADRDLIHRAMTQILSEWQDGGIAPAHIEVLALDQAAEAHRLLRSRNVLGKVVLRIGEE